MKHPSWKYRISGISHDFTETPDLPGTVAKKLGLARDAILSLKVLKKSIDARRGRIHFVYTLEALLENTPPSALSKFPEKDVAPRPGKRPLPVPPAKVKVTGRPVIAGFGPAGIFAALTLVKKGFRPLIVDRGSDVRQRKRDVAGLWKEGRLDPESNAVYGEGGAGTFSDGKLGTRIKDPRKEAVVRAFSRFVEDEAVFTPPVPHLGTDRLVDILQGMRAEITGRGGEILFRSKLEKLVIEKGKLKKVIVNGQAIPADTLILAIGHSAGDTVEMLLRAGVAVTVKPFAMGFRVEHPQRIIDRARYGAHAGHPLLPPASYFLSFKDRVSGRGVYTFCMCPGGHIICASTEAGGLVTNGMSFSKRDSGWANAAVVATVTPADFDVSSPLSGLHFQREIERRAFNRGEGPFYAPAQSIPAFLGRSEASGGGTCTYRPGWNERPLTDILPDRITDAIRRGLTAFNRRIEGFSGDRGMITAVESRTSSPFRLPRDPHTYQSISVEGVYPVGEGAGYAGGIVSSAVDGMKAAEVLVPAD